MLLSLRSVPAAAVTDALKGRLVALFHSIKNPADQRHMCSRLHHRVAAAVAFVFGKCLNSFHAGVLWF